MALHQKSDRIDETFLVLILRLLGKQHLILAHPSDLSFHSYWKTAHNVEVE